MTRLAELEQQVVHFDKLIATLDETRKGLVKQRDEAWDEKINIEQEENANAQGEYDAQMKESYNRGDMQ